MSFICKVDGSEHETIQGLHNVLKKFRIKQSDYWQEVLPRYNVYNGKPIIFKNYDQYISQDLENKNELKEWIKREPERAKDWAINWLKKRRDEKGLAYPPSQAELKTLLCPTMNYYNSIGGYYKIAKELGYNERYNENSLIFTPLNDKCKIICDSREQLPLEIKGLKVKKIDSGDYGLSKKYDKGIYVERKSLSDYCGTLCKGNERFRRELERATKKGNYIVMLVESKISDSLSLEYLFETKHVRASSSFVAKQLRDLLTDFPFSFQVLFVDGREEAAQKLIKIFELGEQVKTTDLQFKYEQGEL